MKPNTTGLKPTTAELSLLTYVDIVNERVAKFGAEPNRPGRRLVCTATRSLFAAYEFHVLWHGPVSDETKGKVLTALDIAAQAIKCEKSEDEKSYRYYLSSNRRAREAKELNDPFLVEEI